jgi:fission 1 protein
MSDCKRSSTTHGYAPSFPVLRCTHYRAHTDISQGLIKSDSRPDQQEGVRLLSEIFRNSRERRRECLYYLALGNYKLGNYAEARRYNELLLELEPANLQAGSLKGLIDEKVAKEGLVGAAIVGGLVVAAGVLGSMMMRGRKR